MNKIIYAFLTSLILTSCAGSYNIQGSSSVSNIDGQMMYLQTRDNKDMKTLDSCDVIHGRFTFIGNIDSVRIGFVSMEANFVLPVVIENGDINVKIDDTQRTVSGTPGNDKLFAFFRNYEQLQNQSLELVHKHDMAIMDGSDMNVVTAQLNEEYMEINKKMDKLVTTFITENFNNVLGPFIFEFLTEGTMPELTPWVDDIMSKATPYFKNSPYVKWYVSEAQRIQNIRNGLEEPDMMRQNPNTQIINAPHPPTPNEMAQPAPANDQTQEPKSSTDNISQE